MCDFHLHANILAGAMKRNRIKLVALDFDLTLVDIHTDSKWNESAANLSKHVRPIFLELIPALLRKGVVICICSFSSQKRLIQHTLQESFGHTLARQILVRCLDGSWSPAPIETVPSSWRSCSRRGKVDHIMSVVSKIYMASNVQLSPQEVVMIDDTLSSVQQAKLDGIQAFLFDCKLPGNGEADEKADIFILLKDCFRARPGTKMATQPLFHKPGRQVDPDFTNGIERESRYSNLESTGKPTAKSLAVRSSSPEQEKEVERKVSSARPLIPRKNLEWDPEKVRKFPCPTQRKMNKACIIM